MRGIKMLTLTKWTYIIKVVLKSRRSKQCICDEIKSKCLVANRKVLGAYIVDNESVWENIVIKDFNCVRELEKISIKDWIGLESLYEEREYHKMWLDFRLTYKKHRR